MAGQRLVVIGSYNRDLALTVARFPHAGETIRADGTLSSHGGKGSNQAVQAVRLGASVILLAGIGNDSSGTEALAFWNREGIETAAIARFPLATGTAAILVDRDGENMIVVAPGANDALSAADVERIALEIARADAVLAQLETPQHATIAAFRIARGHGIRTILNAAPMQDPLDPELLALVDILAVNEGEAAMLMGGDRRDVEVIATTLLERVGEAVLISLGSAGALLARHGQPTAQIGPPVVRVVDTTGAGDALIGAFAAHVVATNDLRAALRWGVAAGSAACTAAGATSSFGTASEIAALERQIPAVDPIIGRAAS